MAHPKTFTTIADHFRTRILSGELAPGTKLPTNREISGQWQVAAATVSRALQALQVEGYIRTTPRGTFAGCSPRTGGGSGDATDVEGLGAEPLTSVAARLAVTSCAAIH